jgi:poly(ADP-ribose) glycohydrolase ARH3
MEFLNRSEPPTRAEVVQKLGNGLKAIDSVPTALYAFLVSVKTETLPEITVRIKSPVLRTIFYAISLGGDSDTIASMAGAIAGAYWGHGHIPQEILRVCEGSKETLKLADDLYETCKSSPMKP